MLTMATARMLLIALLLTGSAVAAEPSSQQGGAFTHSRPADARAYSHPTAAVRREQRMDFTLGQAIFEKLWVSAPASTRSSDGLGPLYNARSCRQCHRGNGRGVVAEGDDQPQLSFVAKLSVPGRAAHPVYGEQLQNFSVQGVTAEGHIDVAYADAVVTFADGERVTLRRPRHRLAGLHYGRPSDALQISYRVASPLVGLGALERLSDAAILARDDADDRDGDGISGRANWITTPAGDTRVGRFGWKAGQADIRSQNVAALATDIGLSSSDWRVPWGDCSDAQTLCRSAPHGSAPGEAGVEVTDALMDVLYTYVSGLAVPPRRDTDDPIVQRGEKLFRQAGCERCHRADYTLASDADGTTETISPWSDLLLHDMGARLADHRPEHEANGREWRTPPLWGVGLTQVVNPRAGFLHDGRARTLMEAVLWHGGEADASRRAVMGMKRAERQALISFLESL